MRRWLIGLTVGLFVGLGGLALGLSSLGATFEQAVGLKWLFNTRGPTKAPKDVVVVAMDSRTGEQLGLPTLPRDWPRSIHGELINALNQRGASLIAFDVHFGRAKDRDSDQEFIDAVQRAGNVVLIELLTGKRQPITDQTGRNVGLIWAEELVPPFPGLADAAAGLATFPLPKEGASVYQFWAFKESTDQAPTLPAVTLQLYARDELAGLLEHVRSVAPDKLAALPTPDDAFADPRELRNLMRGLRVILARSPVPLGHARKTAADSATVTTLSAALEALYTGDAHPFLNFYGPPGTIQTVPYQSVIKGRDPNLPADALDFTGKVVFVGYSDLFDPGQPDRFYTVFTRDDGVDLSGVEIAATAYANLLGNRSLAPVGAWTAVILLFVFGVTIGTAVYMLPGYIGVPTAFGLAVAYAVAAQGVFNELSVVFPVAIPLLVQAPVALFVGLLGQYLLERHRGQRISKAINYYLPDDIADDLAHDRLDPGKLNQVVYSTCLATDMAGFSTISEELPPGELAKFLNDYFETLAAPLKKHGVHVTEFRADAIMCAWTADQPSPEPRRKALLAALDADGAIKDFRERHNMPGIKLRIGLEAGHVYVGHAGGGGRFVYSIVGDSANTASRVEGLNKHLGTQVLATGDVLEGFENLLTRYLGAFQFVGKTEGIPIYEVLATRETAGDRQLQLLDAFTAAMASYQAADWGQAATQFGQIVDDFPEDGPANYFLARCRRFMNEPDKAGDPKVIRMDAK